jgi:hypothetical protein
LESLEIPPGSVGIWKFDEGEGNKAHDSSDYGNDGTIYGATWTNDSKSGNCSIFDGVDDYINCGNDNNLNTPDEMTVMFWIKPNSSQETSSNRGIVAKAQDGVDWSWQIRYGNPDSDYQLGLQVNDVVKGQTWVSVNQNLAPYIWYHVTARFNGTHTSMYLNGKEKDANSASGIEIGNANLYIGQDGWNNVFNGTIDEIRMWNKALTESQIACYYIDTNCDGKIDMMDIGTIARLFGKTFIRQDLNGDCIVDDADIEICQNSDPRCDLDGNGKVDNRDRGQVSRAYGKAWEYQKYDIVNVGDCTIDMRDIGTIARYFGQNCADPTRTIVVPGAIGVGNLVIVVLALAIVFVIVFVGFKYFAKKS